MVLHCKMAKPFKLQAARRTGHILNAAYKGAGVLLKGYGMRAQMPPNREHARNRPAQKGDNARIRINLPWQIDAEMAAIE